MIKDIYSKAYTEVLEIIKYFPKEEYEKIPKEKIEFYKANMDLGYKFQVDPKVDLLKQNILEETYAIIINLYMEYFASEEQKLKINEILDLNQRKEEQDKRLQYYSSQLFKHE